MKKDWEVPATIEMKDDSGLEFHNDISSSIEDPNAIPTHLIFKDLTVSITTPTGEKNTLQNVSGEVEPGEVMAIMGPSGAGKTTLLNVLAGREKRTGGELKSGVVTINGKKMSKSVRRSLGYVLQDDVFFSHLTMKQTLSFAAELRLPDKMTYKEKMAKVDDVIATLDIKKCENTCIGGGLFSVGGLSGGERKRTSIGVELITNPALLMMDEPTSGLDSSTAYSLVRLLKYIAVRDKKAIVCTIHQPSSQIFHFFDKLLLLCHGRVSYYGKASGATDFFSQIEMPCYPNWNPADYMMEMLKSGKEKEDKIIAEFSRVYPHVSDPFDRKMWSKIDGGTKSIEDGSSWEVSVITNPGADKNPVDSTNVVICNAKDNQGETESDEKEVRKWPSSFKTQFSVLSRRTFIQTKANIWDKLNFLQTIVLAIVVGMVWFNTPMTEESLRDRTGVMFFVIVYWGFTPLFQALISFPTERPVINKERAAGMYRLSAYYLAKTISEIPLVVLQPVIFWTIAYWMSGLSRSPLFLVSLMVLLVSSITSQSIGLVIGASVQTFKKALLVASIVMLSFMLLGGYYNSNVPVWLSWVTYVSFITYSFSAMLNVEFSSSDTFRCSVESTMYTACKMSNGTSGITGTEVLQQLNVSVNLWQCILALVAYMMVMRFIAYLALRYLNKPT